MENPVDHSLDLGLVNYVQHPSNPSYIVYRFPDAERASSFEEELNKQNIWFEKGEDEKRGKLYTLYGVHKNDYKKTAKINFIVEAKHKKPLIPFKILRYLILIIGLFMLTLAIVGYCKSY
jgi:hypothetical protein